MREVRQHFTTGRWWLTLEPSSAPRCYGIDVCRIGRHMADRLSIGRVSIARTCRMIDS